MTDISVHGELLQLHALRALVWPRRRTVFVADVHLGKEHTFARHGVPIPHGPSTASLLRLDTLVSTTAAERLVVLGDLMHSTPVPGESWLEALTEFLDRHQQLTVEVCAGNHDRLAGQAEVDARIQWHAQAIQDDPFVLQHHPGSDSRGYVLCGHIHPAVRIGRNRRDTLRVPAFWFRPDHAVLPAFGDFTGGQQVQAEPGDQLWACGPQRVVACHREQAPAACKDTNGKVSS